MVRTQIYLTERQRDKLSAIAKTAGKKQSELIQRGRRSPHQSKGPKYQGGRITSGGWHMEESDRSSRLQVNTGRIGQG